MLCGGVSQHVLVKVMLHRVKIMAVVACTRYSEGDSSHHSEAVVLY